MSVGLEVSGLVVRYGAVEALHGVSLRLEPGETVAVVGRNGAGKTTLLRAVFGFVRPASGSIRFGAADLTARRPHDMVRLGVAYVPEHRGILNELTVLENLRLAALGSRRPETEHIGGVFELFPILGERQQSRAATLSGGQQQMLALGRALMSGPSVLMLDEPSLGLAPQVVDAVFAALGELGRRGVAILLVEQNVRRALQVASRGYLLHLGRVAMEAGAEEILSDRRLYETYLGKAAGVEHPGDSAGPRVSSP